MKSVCLSGQGRNSRFALVGCDLIHKNYFDLIAKLSYRSQLVDVCDIDATALEAAVASIGVNEHTDFSQMFANIQTLREAFR
jgi:UDP-N-acetyl-2-amino-2-deoxyglucuronate dehydrogenase